MTEISIYETNSGSIEVRLRVPSPPAFLKPDMTVSVDLTVAARKGVVAVPRDAVRGAATAAPWVPVVEALLDHLAGGPPRATVKATDKDGRRHTLGVEVQENMQVIIDVVNGL